MSGRLFGGLALVLLCLPFFACEENAVDGGANGGGANPTLADSLAAVAFQGLGEELVWLERLTQSELRNYRFDDHRDAFDAALAEQSDNAIAHLGLSILEVLELNYDADLWTVIDSMHSWPWTPGPGYGSTAPGGEAPDRHHSIVGRQFQLMVSVPMSMQMETVTATPPANLTLANIQNLIRDKVIPALDRAVAHLDVVERSTDTEILFQVGGGGTSEWIIIDLGEILVFSASIRALRAGFAMATAYDMDLFGPDGTYAWVDDITSLGDVWDPWCTTSYSIVENPPYIDLILEEHDRYSWVRAMEDSIVNRVLHHNFENRGAFLSLRDDGQSLRKAQQDLVGVMDRLDGAVTFIRNRPNESEQNVIKLADLTDLDAGLGGPSVPNFAKNWSRVEDVLAFVREVLSGPVTFTEDIGPSRTSYTWTMNLSVMFTRPVADWNDLLPLHEWNLPAGPWIARNRRLAYSFPTGNGYYGFYAWNGSFCDWVEFSNVGTVEIYRTQWEMYPDALQLVDPTGMPIDPNLEFPYFLDYSFNGLFPEMNRSAWINLMSILQ